MPPLDSDHTWTPFLSQHTKELAGERGNPFEAAEGIRKRKKDFIKSENKVKISKELQHCTFSPKISKNTRLINKKAQQTPRKSEKPESKPKKSQPKIKKGYLELYRSRKLCN